MSHCGLVHRMYLVRCRRNMQNTQCQQFSPYTPAFNVASRTLSEILLMLGRLLAKIQAPLVKEAAQPSAELAAAVLLFEVAWADHRISDAELATVRQTLLAEFGIDAATVDELVAESRSQHEDSVGIHRFTRALVEAWTPEQRFQLVVNLWRLAFCDAGLDKHEDATIRKIAELLYVTHGDFITAKRTARHLTTNRPDSPPPSKKALRKV